MSISSLGRSGHHYIIRAQSQVTVKRQPLDSIDSATCRCPQSEEHDEGGVNQLVQALIQALTGDHDCRPKQLNYPGELQKGETRQFPGNGTVAWTPHGAVAKFTDQNGEHQSLRVQGGQLLVGNKRIPLNKTGAIIKLNTAEGPVQLVVGTQGHGANREVSRVAAYGPGEQIATHPAGATEYLDHDALR